MIKDQTLLAARPAAAGTYAVLCLTIVVVLLALLTALDDTQQSALLQEGGALETVSALTYLVAIAVLLPVIRDLWPFAILLAVFSMREFDLDKRLFTEGLFKHAQYFDGTVPLPELLISGCILLALVATGVLVVARGMRGLRHRLMQGDGVALCVVLGVLLAVTSKAADGAGRKLASFGVTISDKAELMALTYEEVAELGMALSFLLAAIAFTRLHFALPASSDLDEVTG